MLGGLMTAVKIGIWVIEHKEALAKVKKASTTAVKDVKKLGKTIETEILHRGV